MNVSRISLALSFGYFASQVYRHGKLPLVISPSNRDSRLTLGCQGKRQGSKPKALPSCLVTRLPPTLRNPNVARRGEVSQHPTTAMLRVDYPSQGRLPGPTTRAG